MKKIKLFVLETLIFMILLNVLGSKTETVCPLDKDFQRSYVGLALSPIYKNQNHREIKIIWGNENFKTGDKIFLFEHLGTSGFEQLYEVTPNTAYGIVPTGIRAQFDEPSIPLFIEQCRTYYVAWMRNGYIRDINCLSNQPTWMYDRRYFLGSLTLANLFLPGTHDSGTYEKGKMIVQDMHRRSLLNPSSQDLDVMTQLVQGIRYIHVQVGYHPNNNQTVWWVHKRSLPVMKLDTIIDHMRMFLQYTREIVLFDVQDFLTGFESRQSYIDLMDYLRTRFGTFLLPSGFNWSTPLHSIWDWSRSDYEAKMGKVVLNFNLHDIPFGFPGSDHTFISYNSIRSRNVEDYFEDLSKAEAPKAKITDDVPLRATLVGLKRSIGTAARQTANYVNPNITIWYHKFWYSLANIVALDFFDASGIVDIAIRSNEFRYRDRDRSIETWMETCTPPNPQSSLTPEEIMNSASVEELLFPRIVDHAVRRIHDMLSGSMNSSSTTPESIRRN